MSARARTALLVVLAAGTILGLAGCGYHGARSLPLPGGVGGDTYQVTLVVSDATNLVPKETCRANDTVIGSVVSVSLDDRLRARVVCEVKASVHLPANVRASLQQTSLLGERFVALDVPYGVDPVGVLKPGAQVPVATTSTAPDVESVLGALSQVLNGGSLNSLQTITHELATALHDSDPHGTLDEVRAAVHSLATHRDDLTAALDGVDHLAGVLAKQRSQIARALDAVPVGLAALDRQRPRLLRALRSLRDLAGVARPLLARVSGATVKDLRNLSPVLTRLRGASGDLASTLQRVVTFPFPRNSLAAMRGDYAGFSGTVQLDLGTLSSLLGVTASGARAPAAGSSPAGSSPAATGTPPAVGLDDLVGVLGAQPTDVTGLLAQLLGGGGSR